MSRCVIYIERQDSDEAFLVEVAKVHATFALWLKRGQHDS